jgi:hypothetical protein
MLIPNKINFSKTTFIKTRRGRRSRDWSGRGLEAMNRMETMGEPSSHIFQRENHKEKRMPMVVGMLIELLVIRPGDKFYKSLLRQFKRKGNLTRKQMECLKKQHDRLVKKKGVSEKASKNCKLSDGNMDKTDSPCGEK